MRPNFLSWLKHGMMLTKKNFPTFVDTFNYMLGRIDNIKGDKDINPQSGVISVDNTDPDHPVIRCDVNKIPNVNGEKLVGDSDLTNASTYSVHVGKRTEQEGGETYATLYNFDQTPTESATATLDSNQGQYDVGSGDWFLVKNGNELKYKKITIETDFEGGGGGGSISVDSDIAALKSQSLEHVESGTNDYYQLYDFNNGSSESQLSDYAFVVRHTDTNGNVSIKYLASESVGCKGNFDYYTDAEGLHWLRGGYIQQARRFYWVSSTQITQSGMIYLDVPMSSTSGTTVVQGASSLPTSNVTDMYIPLW